MPQGIATRVIWFVLASTTLLCCGCRGSGPVKHEVRVALSADAITWLPVRLAQSLGYAEGEGVVISTSDFVGSKGMEALLGESVDVGAGTLLQAMQVAVQGRSIRCFLTLTSRPTMVLAVAPSMADKVRTIGDLKSRAVGVGSPGSVMHLFLNFLLASHGLSPADVGVVTVGTGATSIAALERGKVAAAVLVGAGTTTFVRRYPNSELLADLRTAEGTHRVFGVSPVPLGGGLSARDEWLRKNHETATGFVRAVKKAMQWIRTHSPEEIRATIPEAPRMSDPEADLEAIRLLQHNLSPDGTVPPEAPEAVRKFLAVSDERFRNAHLDLSTIYTNEFASLK